MRGSAPFLLVVAIGCGHPISNDLFYEDATFFAALPSSARFAAPSELRLARVGSSSVLEQAVLASAEVEDLTALVAASGEALRAVAPAERSDVLRAWAPTSAAARIDGSSHAWFVRGDVVRPEEAGDLEWSIEVSADGADPWLPIGSGRHDPTGLGDAAWDLSAHADLLGLAPPGKLQAAYDDLGFEGEAPLVDYLLASEGPPRGWTVGGDHALGFLGGFALTDDGATWSGQAEAAHVSGLGGRATGVLYAAGGDLVFDVCWDADGDETWRAGDEGGGDSGGGESGIPPVGAEASCRVPPP